MRVELSPAYLIHQRPYRDTSLLIEFLTRDHGRIGAIAKGVRGRKNNLAAVLQPFNALLISWSGKNELVTLSQAELQRPSATLAGITYLSGLYANELLYKLLHRGETFPETFHAYERLLSTLTRENEIAENLRYFEMDLLRDLGYELLLTQEGHSEDPVDPEAWYRYVPDTGPLRVSSRFEKGVIVQGSSLLALSRKQLPDKQSRIEARKVTKLALNEILGNKPLASQELLKKWFNFGNEKSRSNTVNESN
ncbi:MAG: DNA repair protein RecO [Gammaproteobacteria bacterium]|nr:DNA repair protein RecO [Gammaproteobacteria bacterium]MDH5692521.1 DNA repair protein RecO [Gammaproteobacteria bacterium]